MQSSVRTQASLKGGLLPGEGRKIHSPICYRSSQKFLVSSLLPGEGSVPALPKTIRYPEENALLMNWSKHSEKQMGGPRRTGSLPSNRLAGETEFAAGHNRISHTGDTVY